MITENATDTYLIKISAVWVGLGLRYEVINSKMAKRRIKIVEMNKLIWYLRSVFLLLLLIILGSCFCITANLFFQLSGLMANYPGYQRDLKEIYTASLSYQIIMTVIIYPVIEEAVFRGFLYSLLYRWKGFLFAILISAVLFGLYHGNIMQGIYGFLSGCLLALVYEWCKSLIAPIILHSSMNLTAVMLQALKISVNHIGWVFFGIMSVVFLIICIKRMGENK